MNQGVFYHGRLLVGFTLCSIAAGAQATMDVHPFASAEINYNSNVFRFADDAEAMRLNHTQKRDDRMQSGSVGVNVLTSYAVYQFNLRGKLTRNDYDYFDFLDHTGRELSADFSGAFGGDWWYKTTFNEYSRLTDFTEISSNFSFRNELTFRAYGAELQYRLWPNIYYHINVDQLRQRYSHPAYLTSNVDTSRAEMGVRYQRSESAKARLFLQVSSDDFPSRNMSSSSVLDVTQQSYLAAADARAAVSDKFSLSSRIGVKARRHGNVSTRDYIGVVYKLENTWQPSGKSRLGVALSRDVAPVELVLANYATVDELGLNSAWMLLHNASIVLNASQRWYDYYYREGVARRDRTLNVAATIRYTPTKYVNLGVDAGRETRVSDLFVDGYSVNTVRFTLQLML